MRSLMRCLTGCITVVLVLGVVGVAVAAVTWYSNSCTMRVGTFNANVTLQGWGSESTCQSVESNGANQVGGFLERIATFGLVSTSWQPGSPDGTVICSGWKGVLHYTVRDYGLTGADIVGHALCSSLSASTRSG